MLCCSGVSKIRLVDFDYVTLSSLNRHATAGLDDVGTPKVKCIEKTLLSICKWVQVDSRVDIWRKEEGGALLEDADWVIGRFSRPQTRVLRFTVIHRCDRQYTDESGFVEVLP